MPTYEYKCDACGHAFEKFQSIKADPIKVCPNCGQESVRKLISMGGGLIFKGSGFYITDYRDKAYADQSKADNGGKAEAKSDASPDAKGDAKSDKPATGEPAKSTESKPAATATPTPSPTPTPAPTPAAKSDS